MKRSRNMVIILLALNLVFGTLLSSAFAAAPQDVEKHWASATLQKWIESGLIKGYKDGSYKPDAPIKRSEFAALLNRALKLSDSQSNLSFSDLPNTHWAYNDIAIAVKAGYLKGAGGKVNPSQNTARQEAAVMIARAIGLETNSDGGVSQFGDADQIAAWSKDAIAALAAKKVLKGDTKGNIRPQADITRAEAVVAIDSAIALEQPAATAKVFDKAGVYGSADKEETIQGNVVISADGVTLQNTVITGDLIIAKEVEDGDVTLKKVTVKGTTKVNGGGENSIHIEDSVMLRVIVDKASGKVRIVAIGATTVQDVIVNSAVKIEESNVTDSGFANIELAKALPKEANVDLVGKFEDVRVLATNIKISIPSGSVSNLLVEDGAADNTINVSKEAQVLKLVLDAVSNLIGDGKIESATINERAKGSEFGNKPVNVDGAAKDDIKVTTPAAGGTGPSTSPSTSPDPSPNPNPGPNPNPTPSCTVDCGNARLSTLSITSSVYDQFQLVQRANDKSIAGAGFSSDVLYYSVDVPRNFTESDVQISVAAAAYAQVSYSVLQHNGARNSGFLQGGQNTFNVHLKSLEDAEVNIFVTSGDGISRKVYEVQFVYERNLQEAFHILNTDSTGSNPHYYLASGSLENGDEVTVTIPAADHSSQQAVTVSHSATYDTGLSLSGFTPANVQGSLHVMVTRGGRTIMDGEYMYDFTPISLNTDGDGINISLWTKQELIEHDTNSNEMHRANYGYHVRFDAQALANENPQFANAVYMNIEWTDIRQQNTIPRTWTKEDTKISWDRFWAIHDIQRVDTYQSYPYNHLFMGSNQVEEVYNQHMYVFAYDANREVIGYYVYTVNFDVDHVGSHVTIMQPQP